MADHNSRRGLRRPDSSTMWDDSERHMSRHNETRERDGRRNRDRDRSRNRERDRDGDRDRDKDRDRDQDRDRDRGHDRHRSGRRGADGGQRDRQHKRYRSRSRSRGHSRERGSTRKDGERERERERDKEQDSRGDKEPVRHRDDAGYRATDRRSASPATLPDVLPTRTKPERTAPMSFRMSGNAYKKHDTSGESAVDGAETSAVDDDDELEVDIDGGDMDAMQAMLGFGGFGTTKNKKVVGNNAGSVSKEKKSQYRQYMNRVGGFNRPLSPPRD
ncbi:hypothetical protein Cpir12675_004692 [Ceratocystis pirilliformis]|uniref:U4/U6.U5 small nuclear ribonucleoprotein 27kDa protein domain-containing protein n=1 Tax=Ceratocystis pirilliformis TaxID=259994 RepID=A0ABR3YVJ7_9PEZI